MKIAICFFGQVKNFNDRLYNSFIQNISNSLNVYEIDYFLATYNNKKYINSATGENHDIDYLSICNYFLFKEKIILDIYADYTINIDNFVNEGLKNYGYAEIWGDNAQESTIRSIRQLYCLHILHNQLINTNYDKYILCRPDCIFDKPLEVTILKNFSNICIPNFNHWFGYNDRFAVVDKIGLTTYCSRYTKLIIYPQKYHSETYLKYTIDESKNTIHLFDNFKFRLLRSNNELSRIDY